MWQSETERLSIRKVCPKAYWYESVGDLLVSVSLISIISIAPAAFYFFSVAIGISVLISIISVFVVAVFMRGHADTLLKKIRYRYLHHEQKAYVGKEEIVL